MNRARVVDAQQTGEFRDDIDAKELGAFVNLVLNGLALRARRATSRPPSSS